MAYITKITTQQKNKERYNVFIDYGKGEEYAFSVNQDVLIKFQLKKGLQLDELDLTEIQFEDDIKKAYNQALVFLSYRMRSEKEIVAHLKSKEVDDQVIPDIIHKLTSLNYVNDLEFAKAYVKTQINTSSKGPGIIKQELFEKGVSRDIVESSLELFSREEQVETALKLISKIQKKGNKVSKIQQKQKTEEMLMRKGFSWDIIQIANEEVEVEDTEEDEEWEAVQYQGRKAHSRYKKYEGREYEQKMKQALYRKGFSMELISRFIEMMKEEE
ncbi:recombination regulator RecX [Cytobacillus suaedae]|nr:recombination regulator RecX [Cytobacillus suaedae]